MDEKLYLVRCSKKTGKIDSAITGYSRALLKLWGLQNTTKSKKTLVFNKNGDILMLFEGGEICPKLTYEYFKESPHKLTNDSRLMSVFITMIEEGEKQCSTTK